MHSTTCIHPPCGFMLPNREQKQRIQAERSHWRVDPLVTSPSCTPEIGLPRLHLHPYQAGSCTGKLAELCKRELGHFRTPDQIRCHCFALLELWYRLALGAVLSYCMLLSRGQGDWQCMCPKHRCHQKQAAQGRHLLNRKLNGKRTWFEALFCGMAWENALAE